MADDVEPLVYDTKGTAHFDLGRALFRHDQEQREFSDAAEDMARLGMGSLAGLGKEAPPAPPKGGVGDIHTQVTEPGQRWWETYRTGRAESLIQPVTRMPTEMPVLPPEAMKYLPLVKGWIDQLCACVNSLKCAPLINQPHAHLAPMVSAICVDVFTNASGVQLAGSYPPPGPCVPIICLDVPDRFMVVLDRFGNELEDHLSYGDVRFSMQRNRTPIRCYGDFDVQLGRFVDPTRFSSPIILKHKDRFCLQGQSKSGANHTAFARITGWAFAVTEITGDGSYKEFCTK